MRLDIRADIEAEKQAAIIAVDSQAEAIRLKFITPGSGQAMTYSEKRNEAARYQANPSIDPSEIPHITAEAALTGVSVEEMADTVLETAALWTQASVAIEMKRMAAKVAIRDAVSVTEIRAAGTIDWSDVLSALEI